MQSHLLGRRGEDRACSYLISKGYQILERNWRHRKAEVDVIASIGDILVIIEVKTRSGTLFGEPTDFIGKEKIRLLRQAANAYVNLKRLDQEIRFDFIGIVKRKDHVKLVHIEDACHSF